jgi:hypothetical protein
MVHVNKNLRTNSSQKVFYFYLKQQNSCCSHNNIMKLVIINSEGNKIIVIWVKRYYVSHKCIHTCIYGHIKLKIK